MPYTPLSPISVNKILKKELILSEKTIIYKAFYLKEKTASIISRENLKNFIIKSIIKRYFI